MARSDPAVEAHLEWLGFVQPTGLVVSATALARAGAILPRLDSEGQALLEASIEKRSAQAGEESEPLIVDFERFARAVLGWTFASKFYAGAGGQPIPAELTVPLPDYGETLSPDIAVREPSALDGEPAWQLLVGLLEPGQDFDCIEPGRRLEATTHGRMERLLRETGVPAGLMCNGRALRLICAPPAESSGWLDFQVREMLTTAGRPICAAMRLLLSQQRLLTLPTTQRLAALLADSRRFQNEVSERLSVQVLHALYELLRGFQAADDASGGTLLQHVLAEQRDEVYRGLLTVLLRLVFLLYAEERGMLPAEQTFERSYSLAALHERLRADEAAHPDTMSQRYGAWAQLVALFRMVHDGASATQLQMPARHGVLFDPDRFHFLEGRTGLRQTHERIEPPLVPDQTVYRVLESLLVLDGERLSYRALDVEQIGSVYETMMGFTLQLATGRSVAIRSGDRHGAASVVDLDELAALAPAKRAKAIEEQAKRKLSPKQTSALREAAELEELHAALLAVIDTAATPEIAPVGALLLQPSEERRRSGSHYTPRSLTEPIVRTTLQPLLARLRGPDRQPPHPEQVLELKVCDPAMGSGAFLVEACRQLAAAVLEGWAAHGGRPELPPDEDERIYAMRLVAQRCLYGVDRNPMAVDLAKMSLWLATLAREHPLTFVDHALRTGDSLVGLTRRQIEAFDWKQSAERFAAIRIREHLERVAELRRQIREAKDDTSDFGLRDMWDEAQAEMAQVRLIGDLVISAFFCGSKERERQARRAKLADAIAEGRLEEHRWIAEEMGDAHRPLRPFHWEVELPEVFDRENPGFDAIVGNPPFGGHVTVVGGNPLYYTEWLRRIHGDTGGKCDVVAHFYRRAFDLIREGGTLGLIATNTIGQGDTRQSGLQWICTHGGHVYAARKRVKWPGAAAVVVSVVHVSRGEADVVPELDGRPVGRISSYLFAGGGDEQPARLAANAGKSFQGSIVLGMGFTFDDTDAKGVATPLAEMRRLIAENPANAEVIFPYIGGEEVNTSPTHSHHRSVINFGERSEQECRARWPQLMAIVEEKVKPDRLRSAETSRSSHGRRAVVWWQHYHQAKELYAAIAPLDRVLVTARVSESAAFTLVSSGTVYSEQVIVFPFDTYAAFCALQSRAHEIWARFFGSSMKDDLRYTPSDCFETFPFPEHWESDPSLEQAGRAYYEHRATLMVANDEGLTKTYNRFHDPGEHDPGIERLRQLHAEMDRAVLRAYGFDHIPTGCEFLLDYEIDEQEWRNRRKPYRYRWPDAVQEEVLARLIELNGRRAAQERRSGAAAAGRDGGRRRRAAAGATQAEGLF